MQRFVIFLAIALAAAPVYGLLTESSAGPATEPLHLAPPVDSNGPPAPPASAEPVPAAFEMPGEDTIFAAAAEVAWRFVDAHHQPRTGLVSSVIDYPYATVWDMGSTLAAMYSAHQLGLVTDEVYHSRTDRALQTLQELPLFGNVAFNKNYEIGRGVPAGRNDRETTEGYGWSSIDLGRLLVWLRIVSDAHPRHLPAAEAIVSRLEMGRIVREGYLHGEDLDRSGRRRSYQEGRLGYEQYAAAGFALWGHSPALALSTSGNTRSIEVMGVPLLEDTRPGGHLTSEPFVLIGLELGSWNAEWESLTRQLLAAQEARYRTTGQLTFVSEDAIPVPPDYFYYYTVEAGGDDFAVVSLTSPDPLPGPRWISSKAAFGWYALQPGSYTWEGVQAVLPAADPRRGWSSGIYEDSGEPTGGQNINTAAVILEAALYHKARRPLLVGATASARDRQ